jgi:hypothetical protein
MRVVLEELLALGNGVEAVEEELVVQMELAPMASAVARIVVLAVARMVAELQVVLQRHRSVAMVEITLLALEAASAMQTLAILELTAAVAPGDMINLAEGLVELGLTLLALWVAVAVGSWWRPRHWWTRRELWSWRRRSRRLRQWWRRSKWRDCYYLHSVIFSSRIRLHWQRT